jgi:hypothetical protein
LDLDQWREAIFRRAFKHLDEKYSLKLAKALPPEALRMTFDVSAVSLSLIALTLL